MADTCTCRQTAPYDCPQCAWYAQKAGVPVRAPATTRDVLAVDAAEADLERKIQTLCATLKYLRYHTRISKQSAPGWPDEAILDPMRPDVLYLLELKRAGALPTPAQRRWLEALAQVERVHVGVYRPADWPRLQDILTRRAPP